MGSALEELPSKTRCMAKHLADDEERDQPPLWRTKVALSSVLMLTVIVATVYGFRWLITEQPAAPEPTVSVDHENTPTPDLDDADASGLTPTVDDTVILHVAGEVHQPGIVELEIDARVVDAIEAAGGPTSDAQLDALNLAAIAHDGEYILVPDSDAVANQPGPATTGSNALPGGDSATVNLNTADATALETLPGVGPATAEQIISHREQHGPFGQLADLESVSGIGPATRERLDGLVTW